MAKQPSPQRRLYDILSEYVGNVPTTLLLGGVIALVTSGLIALIGRDLRGAAIGFLILGLLLLLAAVGAGYNTLRETLMTRKGFYGFNTTMMTLLFLGIASIIIWAGTETNDRWDVTATRQFSLSKQTSTILEDLTLDIEAVAFFVPGNPNQLLVRATTLDLLEEYERRSGRFSFRVVDPELEPEEARRLGVNPDTEPGSVVFIAQDGGLQAVPTLIFQSEGGFFPNPTLEQDFTQAILAVTRTRQKVVYFLVRHGERDAGEVASGEGYGLARFGLEGDNYVVIPWDAAGNGPFPQDAAVVIVAGPQNDLVDGEAEILDQYLRGGGNALFLLDPETPSGFRDLLPTWGVELGTGTVVDLASSVSGNARAPLVSRSRYSLAGVLNVPQGDIQFDPLRFNPITQPVVDVSFFERAAAVIPLGSQAEELNLPNIFFNDNDIVISPFAVTSGVLSWIETDPEENSFSEGDVRGPVAIGVSIDAVAPFGEDPGPDGGVRTQIVVIGDSDFASNRFFTSFGNGDIFLNSVNWLAGDVDLISVRPKLRAPRLLIVTQGEWNFIRWSSLLILPIVVGAVGAFAWWRRR